MKVAMLSPSVSRNAGGIFEVVRDLSRSLDRMPGVSVAAFGVTDAATAQDLPSWGAVPVHTGALLGPAGFAYSPDLRRAFLAWHGDITHLHALWMYSSVLAHTAKRRSGTPYVTTSHGMIDPWAVRNARVKKALAWLCYERAALREVGCLHVLTTAELAAARRLGLKGPFCLVPNGVTLPDPGVDHTPHVPPALAAIKAQGGRILLSLGRLHPKKNLSATIDAFAAVAESRPHWHLAIAGWGADDHAAALRARAEATGLRTRIHFLGPVFGATKAATLAQADAFVLASLSEGFPVAVLEAMAYGLAVAMTPMCNLPEAIAAGAAIEMGSDTGDIARGLTRLLDASDTDRAAMGAAGLALVAGRYSWDTVAAQMLEVYRWQLGGGPPPATVVA